MRRLFASGVAAAVVLLAASSARADVTSWLAVGGGMGLERNHSLARTDSAGALTYSIGVGSTPSAPFVVGGLVRGVTFVNLGTDLGLAVRVATGGFARGDWGLAAEVGALWRSFDNDSYGRWPLQGVLTGGSPWGLQLAVGTELFRLDSEPSAQGVFFALEVDLLRMTLMRQGHSEDWWPNPNPAGGRQETSSR